MSEELQYFIGTIAETEMLGGDSQKLRQLLLEVKGIAIGIEVQLPDDPLHCFQRLGGRTERILVGCQLDHCRWIESKLTGDLFDWFARNINRDGRQIRTRFNVGHDRVSLSGIRQPARLPVLFDRGIWKKNPQANFQTEDPLTDGIASMALGGRRNIKWRALRELSEAVGERSLDLIRDSQELVPPT